MNGNLLYFLFLPSVDTLEGLTSDFRLGFGSFVDKTLYPFSDQLK
jgi:hypothetical protein